MVFCLIIGPWILNLLEKDIYWILKITGHFHGEMHPPIFKSIYKMYCTCALATIVAECVEGLASGRKVMGAIPSNSFQILKLTPDTSLFSFQETPGLIRP